VADLPSLKPLYDQPETITDDFNLSMVDRMPWKLRRNRQLPLRFRDQLPEPPIPLTISTGLELTSSSPPVSPEPPSNQSCTPSLSARVDSQLRRIINTPPNIFGLFRRYNTIEKQSHDPEEHVALQDLSNIPVENDALDPNPFYPFPNRSAFDLGEWHWNGGVQKSQGSFRELVDILGNPNFRLDDIRHVNWDHINKALGTDDDSSEWLDNDAGWVRTPVTISVPYQSRRGIPSEPGAGPRNYVVEDFHHRSLVSVIREKISGLKDLNHFHFEPYELQWELASKPSPVRVQGELYTSPAFIDAHRELQDSPGEPECNLPRVVVALMFWSDVTHLTSFGNAKLWPLYMFFGNKSKYQRCKPSCHLCEHVAYFQKVRVFVTKICSIISLSLTAASKF
jgi:hypothetical protein